MSDKHDNGLLAVPIDPDVQRDYHLSHVLMRRPGNKELEMTDQTSFSSQFFLVMQAISRVFYEGTKWNKKARIVFEYDPEKKKMSVSSFMESAELDREEDQESR